MVMVITHIQQQAKLSTKNSILLNKNNPIGYLNLGEMYQEEGKLEDSEANIEEKEE